MICDEKPAFPLPLLLKKLLWRRLISEVDYTFFNPMMRRPKEIAVENTTHVGKIIGTLRVGA
jgi:hypothetical protein